MIPIPEYLKQYATLKNSEENRITTSIACTCGNDTFTLAENYFTQEEEETDFSLISVVKAKCTCCGKEIILFDSRRTGYDAMTEEHEAEEMSYEPHFRQKGEKLYKIEVEIENDPSLEEFQEATGEDCTLEFYSDAFSWIVIYGIDENGNKSELYDCETA